MNKIERALSRTREGCVIQVEVTAGSSGNRFPKGYNPWRKSIGCQVTEPPVEGKANHAVITLISGVFCVPKSRISIVSGATSSTKRILVRDMECTEVAEILQKNWQDR